MESSRFVSGDESRVMPGLSGVLVLDSDRMCAVSVESRDLVCLWSESARAGLRLARRPGSTGRD